MTTNSTVYNWVRQRRSKIEIIKFRHNCERTPSTRSKPRVIPTIGDPIHEAPGSRQFTKKSTGYVGTVQIRDYKKQPSRHILFDQTIISAEAIRRYTPILSGSLTLCDKGSSLKRKLVVISIIVDRLIIDTLEC